MIPILSGNVASATADAGYTVANSCRFNSADSAYMAITPAGAGSTRKLSFSCWFKLTELAATRGGAYNVFHSVYDGTNKWVISIDDSDKLFIGHYDGSNWDMLLNSNQVLRDLSAFYSLIVIIDTEEGTDTNRAKVFLNGTQVTSWSTETYPAEDFDGIWCKDSATEVGRYAPASAQYGGFYLAEVVSCDGQTYTTTDFGEFDEDSPTIWKPIDVSGLTFGTNGFYLDFEDSANLGNDANGGTDLTESNLDATDQATDTPTNSFATLNPLYLAAASYTIEEGNLQITANASNAWRSLYGNFGITSGKWYWEIKFDAINAGDVDNLAVGIVDVEQVVQTSSNGKFFGTSRGYAYHAKDGKKLTNDTVTANGADYGDAWTAGDIVGCAVDLDNQKIYWSKNGTFQDSGDPTTGATGTGSAFDIGSGYTYLPVAANYYTAENYSFNFGGCPAFTVSSGNADADGYGNFEYAVPSGYYALCTKNLAEYG